MSVAVFFVLFSSYVLYCTNGSGEEPTLWCCLALFVPFFLSLYYFFVGALHAGSDGLCGRGRGVRVLWFLCLARAVSYVSLNE